MLALVKRIEEETMRKMKTNTKTKAMLCDNFSVPGKCDTRVIGIHTGKESTGKRTHYTPTSDYEKADEICSQCPNFKKKSS